MAESLIPKFVYLLNKWGNNKITKNGVKKMLANPTFNNLTSLNLGNLDFIKGQNIIGSVGTIFLVKMKLPNMQTMILSKHCNIKVDAEWETLGHNI